MRLGIQSNKFTREKVTGHSRYLIELLKHIKEIKKPHDSVQLFDFPTSKTYRANESRPARLVKQLSNKLFLSNYGKYDVTFFPSQAIPLLFWRHGTKNIVTIHGIDFAFNKEERSRKISARMFNFFSHKIDAIVCPSKGAKKAVKRLFGFKKVIAINHGINDKVFFKEEESKGLQKKTYDTFLKNRFYLHVSSLKSDKNFDIVLDSFYKFFKVNRANKLVVIGGNDEKISFFKKSIAKMYDSDFLDRIAFFGEIANDKLLRFFYNNAICLINPTLDSFGFPLVEAMSCGCPVIFANSYGSGSVVEKAGLPVDLIGSEFNFKKNDLIGALNRNEQNKSRVSNQIFRHLDDLHKFQNLRSEFSEKSILQAKKFNWNKCAQQHYSLFEELSNV